GGRRHRLRHGRDAGRRAAPPHAGGARAVQRHRGVPGGAGPRRQQRGRGTGVHRLPAIERRAGRATGARLAARGGAMAVAPMVAERALGLAGVTTALLPLALVFVAFSTGRLLALGWRAVERGELAENVPSDLVLDAMWLSAGTSTIALALAVVFGTPVAYLL